MTLGTIIYFEICAACEGKDAQVPNPQRSLNVPFKINIDGDLATLLLGLTAETTDMNFFFGGGWWAYDGPKITDSKIL